MLYQSCGGHSLIGQIWKADYYREYGGEYCYRVSFGHFLGSVTGYSETLEGAQVGAEAAIVLHHQQQEIKDRELSFRFAKQEALF